MLICPMHFWLVIFSNHGACLFNYELTHIQVENNPISLRKLFRKHECFIDYAASTPLLVIVTTLSGMGYASVNEHKPLQTVL